MQEDVGGDKMSSAQDPFYIVKEEIQDSVSVISYDFYNHFFFFYSIFFEG